MRAVRLANLKSITISAWTTTDDYRQRYGCLEYEYSDDVGDSMDGIADLEFHELVKRAKAIGATHSQLEKIGGGSGDASGEAPKEALISLMVRLKRQQEEDSATARRLQWPVTREADRESSPEFCTAAGAKALFGLPSWSAQESAGFSLEPVAVPRSGRSASVPVTCLLHSPHLGATADRVDLLPPLPSTWDDC